MPGTTVTQSSTQNEPELLSFRRWGTQDLFEPLEVDMIAIVSYFERAPPSVAQWSKDRSFFPRGFG